MEEKEKFRIPKGVIIGIVIAVVVLAAAYGGVAYYFSSHFYPRTMINGESVSLMTVEATEEKVRAKAEDYLIAVHDKEDRVTYISGEQIGYAYKSDGSIAKLMEAQKAIAWPVYVAKVHNDTMDINTSYDEAKLTAAIDAMDCFKLENIVAPRDAYLSLTDNGYEIVPEEMGSQPIKEKVIATVKGAIDANQTVVILGNDDYAQPAIKSDDPTLQEKYAVSEKYRTMSVTYDIEGSEQVLDGATIISWITIADDLSISVDRDRVASYVQQLASKYNTYGDVRQFKTSAGDTIDIGGGDYGWVISKSREAEQLVKDIEAGEPVKREPCYEQTAFVKGKDDIGNTYVELDYTNQHLWFYKNGVLVLDSDIVSGNMSKGSGSPDGVYKIISKQSPAVLVGEDYESPVEYFLPFAYNVGFHDAPWRSTFGGTYYLTGGSHGCINMPADAVKKLYSQVETGTPVIAYYREAVKLNSTTAKISQAYSYSSQ